MSDMTRADAIKVLQELWRYKDTDKYAEKEIRQALSIAINSLQIDEQYDLMYEQAGEFIPKSVLEDIKREIAKPLREEKFFDTENAKAQTIALNWCLEIIDKYIREVSR